MPSNLGEHDMLAYFSARDVVHTIADCHQAVQLLEQAKSCSSRTWRVQMKNRESAEEARRCLNNTLLYKRKIEASIYGETADAKRKLLDPLGQEEDSPNAPSAGNTCAGRAG